MLGHKSRKDRDAVHLAAGLAAFALQIRTELILSQERGPLEIVRARQVAMYLAHVGLGMSLARVANVFERDRSTVAHGCHLIEDMREDAQFDAWMDVLTEGLEKITQVDEIAA